MNVKHIAFLREMSALVKGITLNNNLYKIKEDEISDADSDEEKFSEHQGASEQSNEESN